MNLRKALCLEDDGVISLVGAGGKTSLMFRLAKELSGDKETVLTTTTTKIMMPTQEQSPQVILAASPEAVLSSARRLLLKTPMSPPHPRILWRYPAKSPDFFRNISTGFGLQAFSVGYLWRRTGPPKSRSRLPRRTNLSCRYQAVSSSGSSDSRFSENPWIKTGSSGLNTMPGSPVFRRGHPVTEASIAAAALHENGIFKDAPARARRILFLNGADYPEGQAAGRAVAAILLSTCKDPPIERVVVGKPKETPPVIDIFDIRLKDKDEKNRQVVSIFI